MIPSATAFLEQDFEVATQPTQTYEMNMETRRIQGYADGLEAMKQAIYKILLTERYQYIMYSWDYGIELKDLYGQPITYVCPELERRITEALMWDDRIRGVDDFSFQFPQKGTVSASFTVHTVFGDVRAEREVDF